MDICTPEFWPIGHLNTGILYTISNGILYTGNFNTIKKGILYTGNFNTVEKGILYTRIFNTIEKGILYTRILSTGKVLTFSRKRNSIHQNFVYWKNTHSYSEKEF